MSSAWRLFPGTMQNVGKLNIPGDLAFDTIHAPTYLFPIESLLVFSRLLSQALIKDGKTTEEGSNVV